MENKTQEKIKNEIMKDLGLAKLSQEKQDEILAKIGEIILKKIFIETIDKLGDKDGTELKEMLNREDSNPEEIEKFLKAKIDDYDMIVEKIVEEVKRDVKNN